MASKRPTKRSAAAKRGWETRKANERARALQARRAAKKRQAANRKRQDTLRKKKSAAWVGKTLAEQLAKARELGRLEGKREAEREGEREIRRKVKLAHTRIAQETEQKMIAAAAAQAFPDETPENRQKRMLAMWPESEAIPRTEYFGYIKLILWIQHNGFVAREFWAEYRRRQQRSA